MSNRYSFIRLVITFTFMLGVLTGCGIFASDETRIERAKEYIASRDYRTAVIELKKALQGNPDNRDARLLLGKVSFVTGDIEAAEKELRRAEELGARPEEVLVPLGKTLLLLGSHQQLLDEVNTDLTDDIETKSSILVLRGDAHLRLGKLVEAQQAFLSS